MRGGELVLAVAPLLAQAEEVRPGVRVFGAPCHRPICGPLREGFVQPEVVPPAHGHEIAEPHMCQFVQDRVRALDVLEACDLAAEDVVLEDGDAASVLHGACVVLGAEQLVVLAEWVADIELFFEECKALLRHVEEMIVIKVRRERLAAVQAQWIRPELACVFIVHVVVRAGDDCGDVRRHALGAVEGPDIGAS